MAGISEGGVMFAKEAIPRAPLKLASELSRVDRAQEEVVELDDNELRAVSGGPSIIIDQGP